MLYHTMFQGSTRSCCIVALVVSFITIAYATEALKNHAPEKRQDDSFLFFGGWRPIKPGTGVRHHQKSTTGKYHDLLSAIPEPLDTSSTYYSSSHSSYNKDIYNYYPRPAIRPLIKGRTPTYMESIKRRRNQQHRKNGVEVVIPELHGINVQHLKGLHDILLSQIPLSGLTSIPLQHGKAIEVAVEQLPKVSSFIQHGGSGQKNKNGYAGRHSTASNIPYVSSQPIDLKSAINFGIHKNLPLVPVKIPAVEEALDLKNIQIVEIPVPVHGSEVSKGKVSSRYDKRGNKGSSGDRNGYYRGSERQVQIRYEEPSFIPPSFKQFQRYSPPSMLKQQVTDYARKHKPHQIAAELITISDEHIKSLLKNIQVAGKNPNELLKYIPLSEIKSQDNENVHLVVTVPQGQQHSYGGQQDTGYQGRPHRNSKHAGYQEIQLQILEEPGHQGNYESHDNQGGNTHTQNDAYQIVQVQGNTRYQESGPSYTEGNQYQSEEKEVQYHHQQVEGGEGYQRQQSNYGGHNQRSNHQQNHPHIISYQKDNQGQAYIEVNAHIDENGYKREPVLAVELQKGQTIEDAIKALDPETLQKLGANTKDGIEIEVVEIPVEEYGAESKKQETIVAKNSTMSTTTVTTTTVSPSTKKSS